MLYEEAAQGGITISFNLYYRPVGKEVDVERDVKYRLGPELWDHDGTLRGEPKMLTEDDIPLLQEWADDGCDGARQLIRAINRHHIIIVMIGD